MISDDIFSVWDTVKKEVKEHQSEKSEHFSEIHWSLQKTNGSQYKIAKHVGVPTGFNS